MDANIGLHIASLVWLGSFDVSFFSRLGTGGTAPAHWEVNADKRPTIEGAGVGRGGCRGGYRGRCGRPGLRVVSASNQLTPTCSGRAFSIPVKTSCYCSLPSYRPAGAAKDARSGTERRLAPPSARELTVSLAGPFLKGHLDLMRMDQIPEA